MKQIGTLCCAVIILTAALNVQAAATPFYQEIWDLGYELAFNIGTVDREMERPYDAEGHFNSDRVFNYVNRVKVNYNCHKPKVNVKRQREFDNAFYDGFQQGYSDGFHGKPKQQTEFKSRINIEIRKR